MSSSLEIVPAIADERLVTGSRTLPPLRRPELILGVAMMVGVSLLRSLDPDVASGVTSLYVLPISVLAVGFGLVGGVAAGLVATGFFTVWAVREAPELGLEAHLARDIVFLSVGVITGSMAGRLGRALDAARCSAHALAQAEAAVRRGFEDSAVGMAVVGVDGPAENRILRANRALAELLSTTMDDLVEGTSFLRCARPEDEPALRAAMRSLRDGETEVHRQDLEVLRGDGTTVWVDLTSSVVRDVDGRPLYGLSQLIDISAQKRHASHLAELADNDPLTGVFNRRRFDAELARELEQGQAKGTRGAVLVIDLDSFKPINDTFGHDAGDAAILRTAQALVSRLRSSDVVARIGGDEFAVMLRRVDLAEALELAQELVACVDEALGIELPDGRRPGASIGVATYGEGPVRTAAEIVRAADVAMYEAKVRGGHLAMAAEPARLALPR